jgi:hypothetical protein
VKLMNFPFSFCQLTKLGSSRLWNGVAPRHEVIKVPTALHCTALQCTALHCTALHCTALHCTALHCTALHCTALHCTSTWPQSHLVELPYLFVVSPLLHLFSFLIRPLIILFSFLLFHSVFWVREAWGCLVSRSLSLSLVRVRPLQGYWAGVEPS